MNLSDLEQVRNLAKLRHNIKMVADFPTLYDFDLRAHSHDGADVTDLVGMVDRRWLRIAILGRLNGRVAEIESELKTLGVEV